jgi:hypothetical protein
MAPAAPTLLQQYLHFFLFLGIADGNLVTDLFAHGPWPLYGIANAMALGNLPGGQLPGAQDCLSLAR